MHTNKPYIIGITGGSGSGKTSFIRALRKQFTPEELCILSQDEYYKARELQKCDEAGIQNFDLPFSIDYGNFKSDVFRLLNGEEVEKQEYTFNNLLKSPGIIKYRPAPVIIIEGLFVFHDDEVRKRMDLSVFVHAKDNLKVIRRIKRDQLERNYPLEDVLYRYEKHVLPSYEMYIKPFMDDCDLVINNNRSFENGLLVISGFIDSYIRKYRLTTLESTLVKTTK
jgi:uridine kinase